MQILNIKELIMKGFKNSAEETSYTLGQFTPLSQIGRAHV